MKRITTILLAILGFGLASPGIHDTLAGQAASTGSSLPPAWIQHLPWRSIGPAGMGGRITALAVNEKDPSMWWAATASGGLLRTTNNGITFDHQFDRERTVSIGDVAVAPSDPRIVWVGTGEANPRNSVSWGDGVYRSTDGGKTWKNMGLRRSFQIGRIAIHPTRPDTVYVGALGRLWGPSEERGLYKTVDGGKTWERILHVDAKTGVVDVQLHPRNPDVLLAATYERQRDGFDTNDPAVKIAPGSGLWKSTDAGRTWRRITRGLPTGKLGRIGLDYYRKNPDVVYLVLESERIGQEPENAAHAGFTGEDAEVGARLTRITRGGPSEKAGLAVGDIVLSVGGTLVHSYGDLLRQIRMRQAGDTVTVVVSRKRKSVKAELTLGRRPRPSGRSRGPGGSRAVRGSRSSRAFATRLGGQQPNLQDQQGPAGHEHGGVYRSTDGGESFARVNSVNPRPMYFSQVRVDPNDDRHVYVLGVPLYRSRDGGKTFSSDGGRDVHVDHHALWIDPRDGRHMILGNDGGIYVTHDRAEHWDHLNHVAIGQFYHVCVDNRLDYRVYGGLQDNGTWSGPSRSPHGDGPINEDWIRIGSGDGFVCRVEADDPERIYYESQNGALAHRDLASGQARRLRPRAPRGTRYRFNWNTPFLLSHHNTRILYTAGNRVFRSVNRGDRLTAISPEITNTSRGSATALDESPLDPDELYVGTDDGALWRTRNGGHDWTPIYVLRSSASGSKPVLVQGGASRPRRANGSSAAAPASASAADPDVLADPADPDEPDRPDRPGTPAAATEDRPNRFLARLAGRLLEHDRNRDGRVDKSEVPENRLRLFERLDRDRNGVLDARELEGRAASRARAGQDRRGLSSAAGSSSPPASKPEAPAEKSEAAARSGPAVNPAETDTPAPEEEKTTKQPAPEDPITGRWVARRVTSGSRDARGQDRFAFVLRLAPDATVTGTVEARFFGGDITEGRYDARNGRLTFRVEGRRMAMEFSGTLQGGKLEGQFQAGGGRFSLPVEAEREGKSSSGHPVEPGRPLADLVPGPRWVSGLVASRHQRGRVYATLDGHRSDDDTPYVFVSEDRGQTWRSLRANLPDHAGSVRTLAEDRENPDLLYLGTEFRAYVSIDRGSSWTELNGNLPTVAVHAFAQHPTRGEIVAATHGRSLWILDVAVLRQMTPETVRERAHLYRPGRTLLWPRRPSRGGTNRRFVGENPPAGAAIHYSLGRRARSVRLCITTLDGRELGTLEASPDAGLHRVRWDLREAGQAAPRSGSSRPGSSRRPGRGRSVGPGTYRVVLEVDDLTLTRDLVVEAHDG